MSADVIIALGSNVRQSTHIHWAAARLSTLLDDLRLSRRIWTKDVKGSGRLYMNQLASGTTSLTPDELQQVLKQMEAEVHRTKSRVTIDLDLMQYDDRRYHERDWPRPYIQELINDIL